MVKLFFPGHRSPSEESKEEYDENKAEEETKVSPMLVIFGLIFAIFPLSKKDLFSHILEAGAGCWKHMGNTVVATICSVW